MSYTVTADIDTAVALTYSDSGLSHGKWKTQPGGTVATGTHQIFQAENRSGSTVPPEGWAKYVAADGTEFTFKFKDPVSEQNQCSSSMTNIHGPWTLPTPSYPTGGKTWTVTYYISSSATFYDAPVMAEHIVGAHKCEDYSEARVRGFLGEHMAVKLAQVLGANIPPQAKLWCATHPMFLTPSSKALLTRDLAQFAAHRLSDGSAFSASVLDQALMASHDHQQGLLGAAALLSVRRVIEERATTIRNANPRDAELVGLFAALAENNAVNGWTHAVSTYIGDAEGSLEDERADDVLKIIAARLES